MKMTMTLFPQPLSLLTARSLHPRTQRTQAPPRAKRERERERGGQLHVSAHFTAQAFSLNKMLSGGEKGRRTKGLAKGEHEEKGRAREGRGRERATDKLSAKQSRSRGRVVKLYLQHKQSCRQGSSDADANANDDGKGEREEQKEEKEKAKDKHEAEHNDKHEADETDTHRQTYRVRQTHAHTHTRILTQSISLGCDC